MANDNDDHKGVWDELFSLAAGEATVSSPSRGDTVTNDRKQSKRRQSETSTVVEERRASPSSSSCAEATSRTTITTEWPSWLPLGPSLLFSQDDSDVCRGWLPKNQAKDDDDVATADHHDRGKRKQPSISHCQRCGKSPLYHQTQVMDKVRRPKSKTTRQKGADRQEKRLFRLVRDIRCCAHAAIATPLGKEEEDTKKKKPVFSIALEHESPDASPSRQALAYARAAQRFGRQLREALMEHGNDSENLRDKGDALVTAAKELVASSSSSSRATTTTTRAMVHKAVHSAVVRLLVACDDFYYRLYYENLTSRSIVVVPHPTTYFGTPHLAWCVASGQKALPEFIRTCVVQPFLQEKNDDDGSRNKKDSKKVLEELAKYGFGGLVHQVLRQELEAADVMDVVARPHPQEEAESTEHALSFLHTMRFLETVVLFWQQNQEWWRDGSRRVPAEFGHALDQQPVSLAQDEEERFHKSHETPAPPSLQLWRDSCRVWPCHLYSYACPSPPALEQLCRVLQRRGVDHVLEVGAGTGYVAWLLQTRGLAVAPWDVTPTNDVGPNDYHGSTPCFVPVQCANVSRKEEWKRIHRPSGGSVALLLCFPPPLSTMACDALRFYDNESSSGQDPKCVIYIGEFRGLTACPAFETQLLQRHYHCHLRLDCLEWGTDATELTVWTQDTAAPTPPLLQPCSSCGRAPAQHRCRLVRSLVYCSAACCAQHAALQRAHFALHMIPPAVELQWDNARHYTALDPGGTSERGKGQEASQNVSRSKTRTKRRESVVALEGQAERNKKRKRPKGK